MICNKTKIPNFIFKLSKVFIRSIFFISILLFFSVSALAETNSDSLKEANLVVKKNGRVFLMHQSKIPLPDNPVSPSKKKKTIRKFSDISNLRNLESEFKIMGYTHVKFGNQYTKVSDSQLMFKK